jgi:hypothetical protein
MDLTAAVATAAGALQVMTVQFDDPKVGWR